MHQPQEGYNMKSRDNIRERFEALEQQMQVIGAHTRTVERQLRWWHVPWGVAAVAALNLGMLLALTVQTLAIEASRLTIGLNFTGSTFLVDSGFIPPDTMGAVGPSHIVELLNGHYAVYRKSDGVRVQTSSLDQFWINAGASPTAGFTADPRVLYDPFSQRWFASTANFVAPELGGDNLLLAVSSTSDPTVGWAGFKIPFSGPGGDFPTLGFNRDGVYLYGSSAVVVVPKNDLLASPPTIANATILQSRELGTPHGGKAQPVVDLDNTGLPATVLTPFDIPSSQFKRSTIAGEITSPVLDTSDGFISVTPFDVLFNVGAKQPDSTVTIFAGTFDFMSSVILRNAVIWGVQGVANQGRAALRWFAIDANTNVILQEGLIADPNQDVYMGSIAVNEFDDVVIGFNISSTSQFVSSYAVLGTTVNGVTTFGEPLLLQAGVARYELTGGAPVARWGDYSATVVDPTDPFTFWTFQEWVSAENIWSTQITQLKLLQPSTSCLGTGIARLQGRVRTVADRVGIPDVTLTLSGSGGCQDTTTTNATGHYVFRTLGSGTYTVTPEKAGCTFIPASRTVTLVEADLQRARFRGICLDPEPELSVSR
jgi:Carboxypeptidase regulatory-like domain